MVDTFGKDQRMILQKCSGQCQQLCIAAILVCTVFLYLYNEPSNCQSVTINTETELIGGIQDKSHFWTQIRNDYEKAKLFIKKVNLSGRNISNLRCVNMSTKPPTPVCLHNTTKDYPISYMLLKTKTWEKHHVMDVQSELRSNPDYGFIDLGANIGVYSLTAANMGHKVVAVEPYAENILRLQHASRLAGTTNLIVVLQNGLSDKRVDAELKLSTHNQGLTEVNTNNTPCTGNCPPRLKTILLSDLRYVVSFKQAIMKIDIQGSEQVAFTTFETLIQTVDIPSVYMEWDIMRRARKDKLQNVKVLHLIEVMHSHGYVPHKLRFRGGQALNKSVDYQLWPYDIVWRHEPQT